MADVIRCRLRQMLKHRGMSQNDLAERTGKSKEKISAYANGKLVMSLRTAALIAHVLNCTIDELYTFEFDGRQKK